MRTRDRRGSVLMWALATLLVVGAPDASRGVAVEPASLPALDEDATLDTYLRYAALNNAGLEAAFNRWKAALERIPQVRSLPDPRFNYAYFIEEVETRVGPQRQKFGLSQTLPWFGTLGLREDVATEAAGAAHAVYAQAKLQLFRRVKVAYHEYWYLARAIAVTGEHVQLVSNLESVARTRFKTGSAPHSAVIQAQVELGKLTDSLRSLESMRSPVVAGLNAALNRPSDLPLAWPRSLPESAVSFSDAQAAQWLTANNPDLRRLAHLEAKGEAGIGLARRATYPRITLGVDYVDTGNAVGAGVADSGKDPVVAMVSVSVPLWYGKNRAAAREARLRRAAAAEDRVDADNRLRSELDLALYHYRDAQRKISLYADELIPKARESLKVNRLAFESGKTGFLNLVDSQRVLIEFELAYERARVNRLQWLADLEMITGKTLLDSSREESMQVE